MKKASWLLVLMFWVTINLSAQTFDEWFRQNSTQLKYLIAQISALDAYSTALEDGYWITGGGLNGIAGIQAEDTTMHGRHFSSLEIVRSAVRADPQVADIRQFCGTVRQLAMLIASEGTALDAVIADNLEAACEQDLGWLDVLLTDGDIALEDAERLKLIRMIYSNAKARMTFAVGVLGDLRGIKKIG
jgi:hypothetical protein